MFGNPSFRVSASFLIWSVPVVPNIRALRLFLRSLVHGIPVFVIGLFGKFRSHRLQASAQLLHPGWSRNKASDSVHPGYASCLQPPRFLRHSSILDDVGHMYLMQGDYKLSIQSHMVFRAAGVHSYCPFIVESFIH